MSDFEYQDDRWTDNARECPYCGKRMKSSEDCPCSTAPVVVEPPVVVPGGGYSIYPSVHRTPEQLAAWRKQCDEYDEAGRNGAFEEKREEPTAPEPDLVEVEAVIRRYGR